MILATQKPNATIVPTVIRSNPLSLDTIITTNNGDKELKDLTLNDKVLGIDGNWYNILSFTPIHKPRKMFEIHFSNGIVKCSDTHQWTYWDNNVNITTDTLDLFENKNYFIENKCIFGKKEDNIILKNIKEINPIESRCIITDTPDGLFEINTIE